MMTRREFLGASAAAAIGVAACSDDERGSGPATAVPRTAAEATPVAAATPADAATTTLAPTPACGDDDDETPAQTEGPFFTPNSPERTSLREPGIAGEQMTVSGLVLSTACRPVSGALLDFWQADDAGEYDNSGFRLRGHQFAANDGTFRLETITPGLYTGRTRHIHVKVQAPGQPALTTQLYFPDEPSNGQDGIFDRALLMEVAAGAGGKQATFNFVLELA
jgi:protocatechuate 3,4-dioxygenase beta subunit